MPRKPVKIPLKELHPTEYLIPEDKLDEIAAHYDGTPESMKPIMAVGKPGNYFPENGNKRALFLAMRGHKYILGFPEDADEFPDDFEDCKALAKQAEDHGVNSLEDLKRNIVSRAEFEKRMKERR